MFVVGDKCYRLSILEILLYPESYFQFFRLFKDQQAVEQVCRYKPTFSIIKFPIGGYKSLNDFIPQGTFELVNFCLCGLVIFSNFKTTDPYKIEKSNTKDSAKLGRDSLASLAIATYISEVIGLRCLAMVSSRLHA